MKRAANLVGASAVAVTLIVNGFRFWLFEVTNSHGDDFRFYYSMARIGLTNGWSRIYDQSLQCAPIGPISETTLHCPALALPPVAWLVTPFTLLPYTSAYPVWVALLGMCFVAIVMLLWQGFPEPKAIYAAGAFTLFPLAYCLYLGQVTIIALLGVTLAWSLIRSRHPHLAGIALVLTLAKPQVVLLVPLALAVAGHWRTVLVFAAISLGVALISLVMLGAHGVSAYASIARDELNWELNFVYTLAGVVGHTIATGLQYILAALALVTAWRFRARLDAVILAGILGSALFSPYWHLADYVVLVPAAAFQLSLGPRVPALAIAIALFAVGSPFVVGTTFVPALVQVGSWLVLEIIWLLWLASRPSTAFTQEGSTSKSLHPAVAS